MAVHGEVGSALSLGKLGLALAKGHVAHAAVGSMLGLWFATAALAAITAGMLLFQTTDCKISDDTNSKADQR